MAGVFRMVEKNTELLQSLSNQIDALSNNEKRTERRLLNNKADVVLFFSFDIVNSTSYKTINYFGWAQVLNLLFKELREDVRNYINGSEMWRVLGDEAIFIIKIRDEEELREYISKIFGIMIATIYKLKKGKFFKSDHNFNMMKLQNILSLKTTAWIAVMMISVRIMLIIFSSVINLRRDMIYLNFWETTLTPDFGFRSKRRMDEWF